MNVAAKVSQYFKSVTCKLWIMLKYAAAKLSNAFNLVPYNNKLIYMASKKLNFIKMLGKGERFYFNKDLFDILACVVLKLEMDNVRG